VLAEELGHVLMGHRLVESTEPGKPAIGLLEPRRHFYEREARDVRPGGKANSSKPGLTLSERRFREFDEFLFRDRLAIGKWADGASETAASQGRAFEESRQALPNVGDC